MAVARPEPGGPALSEEEIIRLAGALAAGGAGRSPGLSRGIGDDAAVLALSAGDYVVTTDLLVEGVHFDLGLMGAEDAGRRAMAANLSDLAAMGAWPRWGFLSLGLKAPARSGLVEGLIRGLTALGEEHGLALAGGDTVRAPQTLLNLCLIGAMQGVRPVLRSGARPGDAVCVTGVPGLSAGGLAWLLAGLERPELLDDPLAAPLIQAHRRPAPRLAAGRALAGSGLVTAMMDISDGIASDLARLALASGAGALVREAWLPPAPALTEAARRLGADPQAQPLAWALAGGEDFELLFTCAPESVAGLSRLVAEAEPGLMVSRVGEMISGAGLFLEMADGRRRDIAFRGYDHFGHDQNPKGESPS